MSFTLRQAQASQQVVTGKFCLPVPLTLTGRYSTAPLVNLSITTLTQTAGVATATTSTPHNFRTGDMVLIAGADFYQYNGWKKITVTTTTAFTYFVHSGATSPATGTKTAKKNGCLATGTGTLALTEFQEGQWLYDPVQNAVRQVDKIISDTSWTFTQNFPANVSAQPVQVARGYLYRGISVLNSGAAAGVFLETAVPEASPAVTLWEDAGLNPVCGDATDTTFYILTE